LEVQKVSACAYAFTGDKVENFYRRLKVLSQFVSIVANPVICAILALFIIVRRDSEGRREDFLTAFGFLAFCVIAIYLQWLITKLTPTTADARLLRIDHSLGIDPSHFATWMYGRHHHLFTFLLWVYNLLAPVMAITWIIERNHTMRRALLFGGIFCWFFYAAIPAVGPIYYTHGGSADALRNCFPSMHFTWALLIALNSRSWLRWPLWVYAGLIGISTIALGQHYVIDLIAALPYTAAMQLLAKANRFPAVSFYRPVVVRSSLK
jgi:membrane-associated phospholipid phosphatase